ncbi:hypothetical protein [Gluconobacter japonicus]
MQHISDPSTGKRVSRLNPESEWFLQNVPGLRIIEQDLWDAVKARQSKCSTARNKGTCENRLTIRRDALEKSVLNGLRTQMMKPALFKEFCEEFTREVNRLRMEKGADLVALKSELPKIERELDKAVQAILDGFASPALKTRMEELEARKAEIETRLVDAPAAPQHGGIVSPEDRDAPRESSK